MTPFKFHIGETVLCRESFLDETWVLVNVVEQVSNKTTLDWLKNNSSFFAGNCNDVPPMGDIAKLMPLVYLARRCDAQSIVNSSFYITENRLKKITPGFMATELAQ